MLHLDMVDDRIAWFSQVGSPTSELELIVTWSDSRDPHRFEARIELLAPVVQTARGDGFLLHLRVTNVGDTIWRSGAGDDSGIVKVGVQALDRDGTIDQRDYFRIPLPCPVKPGETVELRAPVPLLPGAPESFSVDLVAEHVCWFAHHGSRPVSFELLG